MRILGRLRDRLLRRRKKHQSQAEKLADLSHPTIDPHWDQVKKNMPGYAGELEDRRRRHGR